MDDLLTLYTEWRTEQPVQVEQLPGAGSNRVYYRFADANCDTTIGCIGTNRDENHAFISLARHFSSKGFPVPKVLAVSSDEMCYLQEDLGSLSLFDAIAEGRKAGGRYSAAERELLSQTIRQLPRLQFEGAKGLDFSVCFPQAELDLMGVMFDLNYFKYYFLKPSGTEFHEVKLEKDFQRLAADLLSEPSDSFMYRDFQARNVMMVNGQSHFIDFQGGRRGPFYYDLASFLWQASARYPDELRQQLLDDYYAAASALRPMPSRSHFDSRLRLFVFFRLLQVLGAYGYRGYFERKKHFIDSIPPALESLRQLLENQELPYPHLNQTIRCLLAEKNTSHGPQTPGSLVVRIYSFSYKKGIPEDKSGNGGGYVFDCRSTHNPGRYPEYKHLTGLDPEVIKFLEEDGEILRFLDSVYRLADAHVERYLERGFTSLMFCFGCTGGQHRSVYCAQHLAQHLHQRYGIEVRLCHREQNISSVIHAN